MFFKSFKRQGTPSLKTGLPKASESKFYNDYRYSLTLTALIVISSLLPTTLFQSLGIEHTIAHAEPSNFTKAAKKAMPAVVSIQVMKRTKLPEVSGFEEEFLRHFFGREFPRGKGKRSPGQRRGGEQQGQGVRLYHQ